MTYHGLKLNNRRYWKNYTIKPEVSVKFHCHQISVANHCWTWLRIPSIHERIVLIVCLMYVITRPSNRPIVGSHCKDKSLSCECIVCIIHFLMLRRNVTAKGVVIDISERSQLRHQIA